MQHIILIYVAVSYVFTQQHYAYLFTQQHCLCSSITPALYLFMQQYYGYLIEYGIIIAAKRLSNTISVVTLKSCGYSVYA